MNYKYGLTNGVKLMFFLKVFFLYLNVLRSARYLSPLIYTLANLKVVTEACMACCSCCNSFHFSNH